MTFNPTLKGVLLSLERYLTEVNDSYTSTEWEEVDHRNMTGESEEHDEWAVYGFTDPMAGEPPF